MSDREDARRRSTVVLAVSGAVSQIRAGGERLLHGVLAAESCSFCGGRLRGADRLRASRQDVCDACDERLPWWRRADGCPRCGMPEDPGLPGSEAAWRRDEARDEAPCPRCLAEGSPLHRCLAATRYAEPLPRLLLAFKNPRGPFGPSPVVWRAIDHLVDALAQRARALLGGAPEATTAIPLHATRRRRRGFNQADLIAHRLALRLDSPFEPSLLERVRDTRSQAGRSASARRAHLRGAFRATRPIAGSARVLLVDDVLTTGSTLDAAGDALLAGGAGEVWAVVLAATVAQRRRAVGAVSFDVDPDEDADASPPSATSTTGATSAAGGPDVSFALASSPTPRSEADDGRPFLSVVAPSDVARISAAHTRPAQTRVTPPGAFE